MGSGVGARSAGSLGGTRLACHGGSSVGVKLNWREFDCTLRGPDDDCSNVYRFLACVRESYGCSEEERVFAIAGGNRVLSMESENACSW